MEENDTKNGWIRWCGIELHCDEKEDKSFGAGRLHTPTTVFLYDDEQHRYNFSVAYTLVKIRVCESVPFLTFVILVLFMLIPTTRGYQLAEIN